MLNCNCADCSCKKKGVSGLSNCQYGLPTPISGLNGLKFDLTQSVVGGAIGALVGYAGGWDWKLSAAVGAVTSGFILPSLGNS